MKKCLALTLFALAACSQGSEPDPSQPAEGSEHIACAVDGAADFAEVCAVERVTGDGKLGLVVRHPGGGFRRFEVVPGQGVTVTDGADAGTVKVVGDRLEVTVGADRYRFPYTAGGDAGSK
jgi:hypothetical protein